jgi:Kef-type K+ transport system membrane component KefB
MGGTFHISVELQYLLVVVGVLIVPRVLQRVQIPSAITCVAVGATLGIGFGLFHDDLVFPMLSTLGMVSLFLFVGMEVDVEELKRGVDILVGHLVLKVGALALGAATLGLVFDLPWRPSLIMALALVTPSTGFILDSLPTLDLTQTQRAWVKTKAIASELVALGVLFLVVQSGSVERLGVSTVALVLTIAVLPLVFHVFAAHVLPFAPKSEFAFLIVLALVCAYVTRHLGVYYLVGGFVVGVTAFRLRKRLPALSSDRLRTGIELFASFFMPFYFFKAGLHLERDYFVEQSIVLGLVFVAIAVPLRVGMVAGFRQRALGESWKDGGRVGLSLVPTLGFTLVLAEILGERYALPGRLFGALVVFALVNTALPGLLLRAARQGFEHPAASRDERPADTRTDEAEMHGAALATVTSES